MPPTALPEEETQAQRPMSSGSPPWLLGSRSPQRNIYFADNPEYIKDDTNRPSYSQSDSKVGETAPAPLPWVWGRYDGGLSPLFPRLAGLPGSSTRQSFRSEPSFSRHQSPQQRHGSFTNLLRSQNSGPLSWSPAYAPINVVPYLPEEELYTPINPFKLGPADSKINRPSYGFDHHIPQSSLSSNGSQNSIPLPVQTPDDRLHGLTWYKWLAKAVAIMLELFFIKIPHQIYLHLLLRLPLLYFSRVTRVFEDAQLSMPDIQEAAFAYATQWRDNSPGVIFTTRLPTDVVVAPHILNFKHSWEVFIDTLINEWTTQNVVATLMLSAILTMLQIDAAAADPVARTTALISLICALMSVLFGSMYIIRFGTMRKMHKAATWAEEARRTSTSLLWNGWIMLAIPGVWMAWSTICFVTCIMAFAWRTGAVGDPQNTALSNNAAFGLRLGMTTVLTVALVYLVLIIRTFQRYGDSMDRRWDQKVVQQWAKEANETPQSWGTHFSEEMNSQANTGQSPWSMAFGSTDRLFQRRFTTAPFNAVKVLDFPPGHAQHYPQFLLLSNKNIPLENWSAFTQELEAACYPDEDNSEFTLSEAVKDILVAWNKDFFNPHSTEVILCLEEPVNGPDIHALYLVHKYQGIYGPMPSPQAYGLKSVTIIPLGDGSDAGQQSSPPTPVPKPSPVLPSRSRRPHRTSKDPNAVDAGTPRSNLQGRAYDYI
ncbi:hypothetical protein R3P38DRAFT_2910819 [Favolaschia claudopus]|uniref:Uncharacterized protein n=1 Tax=Favolaschia claudopus TaxID=2862362 RepID=A0AAW0CCB4_9AGAR